MRHLFLCILLVFSGCSDRVSQLGLDPKSTVAPARPTVAPDRLLVQFQTLGCGCQLGSVEFGLLQLPGVGTIEWELDRSRLWMIFLDDQRPTDDAIARAIADFDVVIDSIERP